MAFPLLDADYRSRVGNYPTAYASIEGDGNDVGIKIAVGWEACGNSGPRVLSVSHSMVNGVNGVHNLRLYPF